MNTLLNKLSSLIYKKFNIPPKSISSVNYKSDIINVDTLANIIRLKSHRAYHIFTTVDLSPQSLSLFLVVTLLSSVPTKKIALGFINNINVYRGVVPLHVYHLIEVIYYNSRLLSECSEYRERVVSLSDDVLDFYIGMYDIYMKINLNSNQLNTQINIENKLDNKLDIDDIDKDTKSLLRKIFLLERSDFLDNLFYNLKEIKKMSKMTYSYILAETVKQTFNKEIKDLEIILTDTGFLLFYNKDLIKKEYCLKLSKIFKFFFKLKKVEYLSRKLRKVKYTLFINKIYFYSCEEIINQRDIYKEIDLILRGLYLEDNQFYNLISEIENGLMKELVSSTNKELESNTYKNSAGLSDIVSQMMSEMYKRTDNVIFK